MIDMNVAARKPSELEIVTSPAGKTVIYFHIAGKTVIRITLDNPSNFKLDDRR